MEAAAAWGEAVMAREVGETAASRAPFVEIAHQNGGHRFALSGGMDDRRRLPTPPQARQVEMHAEHAHGRFLDSHFRHGSAARFEIGKMEHIMRADLRVLADQYGIAVPAHRIGLHVDRHGFITAEIIEQ